MSSNPIVERVVQFIRIHPPLDLLNENTLFLLGGKILITYFDKGDYIFKKNNQPGEYFYLVRKGSVEIKDPDTNVLIDVCEPGDIFGIRALLGGDVYLADSVAQESTLIYLIPVKIFKTIMDQNPQVKDYFLAGLASGINTKGTPFRALHKHKALDHNNGIKPLPIETKKKVYTSSPDTSIADGAKMMRAKRIGSLIVVDDKGNIAGIVTDQDLRNFVASENVDTSMSLDRIMSSPVICVKPDLSYLEYLLIMMNAGVRHLCVTENGTTGSVLLGIITERDLLTNQSYSPIVFARQIESCNSLDELRSLWLHRTHIVQKLMQDDTPIQSLSNICTHFTDTLIHKIIKLENIDIDFAWIAVGSYGRKEQIILTDMDHFWIYADGSNFTAQLNKAIHLTEIMATFGFIREPAGIEAANDKWCQSLSEWKQTFSNWIHEPTELAVLNCSIFFDSRCIAGDCTLLNHLQKSISSHLVKKPLITHFLARDIMRIPPPLSFFKNFIVEKDGDHKDKFDIKLRVLLPIIDAARVLALFYDIKEASTIDRFLIATSHDQSKQELYSSAIEALIFTLKLKVKEGLKNNTDGRYISIHEISKLDKMQLRNIFQVIDDLHAHINFKFQPHKL